MVTRRTLIFIIGALIVSLLSVGASTSNGLPEASAVEEGAMTAAATCKTVTYRDPSYLATDDSGTHTQGIGLLSADAEFGYDASQGEAYQFTSARATGGEATAVGRTRLGHGLNLINNSSTNLTVDATLYHSMRGYTEAVSHNYDAGLEPFHTDPSTESNVRYRIGSKQGSNPESFSAYLYNPPTIKTSPIGPIPGATDENHANSGTYTWSMSVPANTTSTLLTWADLEVVDHAEAAEPTTTAHTLTDFDEDTSSEQWNVRAYRVDWTLTSDHHWTNC